jgi:hypothetical protein
MARATGLQTREQLRRLVASKVAGVPYMRAGRHAVSVRNPTLSEHAPEPRRDVGVAVGHHSLLKCPARREGVR